MNRPEDIPADYSRLQVVDSPRALFRARFKGPVNCILYPSRLEGCFNELAWTLQDAKAGAPRQDVRRISPSSLPHLIRRFPDFAQELELIQKDMDAAAKSGRNFEPYLRLVAPLGYEDRELHDFHHDTLSRTQAPRLMRCYNVAATHWARNEDVAPVAGKIDLFTLRSGAQEYKFNVGDIWLHCGYPQVEVAFIHKAPPVGVDDAPRLVLVG